MIVYGFESNTRKRVFLSIEKFFLVLGVSFPYLGAILWYVLNVVQCGSKFIPVYMIYAALDKSD